MSSDGQHEDKRADPLRLGEGELGNGAETGDDRGFDGAEYVADAGGNQPGVVADPTNDHHFLPQTTVEVLDASANRFTFADGRTREVHRLRDGTIDSVTDSAVGPQLARGLEVIQAWRRRDDGRYEGLKADGTGGWQVATGGCEDFSVSEDGSISFKPVEGFSSGATYKISPDGSLTTTTNTSAEWRQTVSTEGGAYEKLNIRYNDGTTVAVEGKTVVRTEGSVKTQVIDADKVQIASGGGTISLTRDENGAIVQESVDPWGRRAVDKRHNLDMADYTNKLTWRNGAVTLEWYNNILGVNYRMFDTRETPIEYMKKRFDVAGPLRPLPL